MLNRTKSCFAVLIASLFAISANATMLTTHINVDNDFVAYLSTDDSVAGTQFREVNYPPYIWNETITDTVSLSAGQDYFLHILARDGGWIGGFIGEFSLDSGDHVFANGSDHLVTGVDHWFGNNEGWGQPYDSSLVDLGDLGVSPWNKSGDLVNMDPAANWIWAGNPYNDNTVYFSTKISAVTAAVSEPSIIALLVTGLFGMRIFRRQTASIR